jgi:hypothetical protein
LWHLFVNLLLVSGPIRQKLWMAHLAFWAVLLLCILLSMWMLTPGAVERVTWALPLRGRWLRRFLVGVLFAGGFFCLFLFGSSGLGFFLLFPWLAR